VAPPLRVAVLASGFGSTLEALAGLWSPPDSPAVIVLVVCDRPGARVIERARALGLPVALIERHGANLETWGQALTARLREARAELIILAGFLSILPASWVEAWHGRAINLHPSLLPRYGGRGMHGFRVHEAVLAAHEPETGATVHLVTADVDAGPTIAQSRLAVRPSDTPESLRARLAPVEVELLSATVLRFARGELPLPYR
jgi:phosphoribosylglycinamide formyltransferase-1